MSILENVFKSYPFYAAASLLRLGLFYYIAVKFGKHSFVAYNSYVFYSEIIMNIACAGTIAAFTVNKGMCDRLAAAALFENSFILLLCIGGACLYGLGLVSVDPYMSLPLLLVIILGRVNNQMFCRHFLFNKSITASIINDIIGSYLWVIVILTVACFYPITNINSFIYIWGLFLILNNVFNYYKNRQIIFIKSAFTNFFPFFKIYRASLQFTLVNAIFANVVSVMVIHKYTNIILVSSYLISAKVIGFLSDISTGFVSMLFSNNLKKLDEVTGRINWFWLGAVTTNLGLFFGIFLFVYLFRQTIYFYLNNQLSPEYISFLLWLVPLYAVNNIRILNGVYLQRHGLFHYLNKMSFFQLSLLLMLYLTPLTIHQFISLQLIFILLFTTTDVVYWCTRGYKMRVQLLIT
jgi:hypothetical protein